jgi:hypothetical protein
MIQVEQIESYFARLDDLIAGWIADSRFDYIGARSLHRCRSLPVERHFAPDRRRAVSLPIDARIDTFPVERRRCIVRYGGPWRRAAINQTILMPGR